MGLVALIVRELRVKDPIIDLRVFRERTYATGAFLITLVGFVLFASLVLVPIMLQTLLRYPPLQAGIAMAPRGLGSLIAMPLVGLLMARVDPRKLLAAGFLLGAWTMFWLAGFDLSVGYWDIFWPQFIQGIALGLMFVPLTTITMDRISREHMGNATSLFNLVRNIGGSAGIAIVETRIANARQFHTNVIWPATSMAYSLQNQLWLANLKAAFIARGADAATATQRAYAAAWGMVQQQAAILSFIDMFAFLGVRVPPHDSAHPAHAPADARRRAIPPLPWTSSPHPDCGSPTIP